MPSHTSVGTSSIRRVITKRVVTVAVTGLLALTSCVDGPATPPDMDVGAPGPVFEFAPVFSLTGPNGAAAQSLAQAGALDEAFKRVNRFRAIVRRVSNNDVVVADLTIPSHMGGFELARALTERGSTLPVAGISGYWQGHDSQVKDRGLLGVLGKPFDVDELQEFVTKMLALFDDTDRTDTP